MHKHHCKVFKSINDFEQQQSQRTRSWDEYKQHLVRDFLPPKSDQRKVHRNLISVVTNCSLHPQRRPNRRGPTLYHPVSASPKLKLSQVPLLIHSRAQAYCATCRRTAVQLATSKINLNRCPHCQLVFSCTDCASTPPHSSSTCTAYQIHALIENFRIAFFEDTGKASPVTCTQFPLKTRKRLADAEGWYDYFARVSDKPQIANIITHDFSGLTHAARKAGSATDLEAQERMRLFLLCATDNLTMPLTIVAALEDIELEKPDLKVHVVGATGRELLAMGNFEEILHLVPSLRSLYITAIGPGLAPDGGSAVHDAPQLLPKTKVECCPGCKTNGRTRFFAVYSGLYHNFASKPEYERPDLVVLFNSGWVDGDDAESDWAPTIRSIVGSRVPALFTTYNAQEAQNEKSRLESMGAKFLVEPKENKWRGLVPTPEFLDEEYGTWHQNAWRYVVKGQGK
jgi:splicing suppressor protein 51